MEHLTIRDVTRLFEYVRDLYELRDHDGFKQQAVKGIADLVTADLYTYNEISTTKQLVTGYAIWPTEFPLLKDAPEIVGRYQHQHPIILHYLTRGVGNVTKISDFMTYREFRRTDLHNEFYRPMGIPYGIGSGISFMQDCLIGVGLHRSGKDYSERDRRMLSELQPHMLQAYKNSQAVTRLHQETAAYLGALDTLDAAIACLSPQLTIQWMTPSAERVLTAYGLIARRRIDRLCRSLIEWVRAQEALLSSPAEALRPPRPCSIPSATGTLMIRLLRHGSLRLLLLEDHRAAPSLAALAALGLSPRETEILGWVAQGKTNPEIGIILGISPRTAQKHLERIYIKLGVENRHAAITMAMDAMRQERNGKNYD